MTGPEFQAIRVRLGLTQPALAELLGYTKSGITVSAFERAKNPRDVPLTLALLMEAMDGGFWSSTWPSRDTFRRKPRGVDAVAA